MVDVVLFLILLLSFELRFFPFIPRQFLAVVFLTVVFHLNGICAAFIGIVVVLSRFTFFFLFFCVPSSFSVLFFFPLLFHVLLCCLFLLPFSLYFVSFFGCFVFFCFMLLYIAVYSCIFIFSVLNSLSRILRLDYVWNFVFTLLKKREN